MKGEEMCGTWQKLEISAKFMSASLKRREHFRDLDVDWRIILNCVFHKWDGISSVAELPLAPQGLCAVCSWLYVVFPIAAIVCSREIF
jgi:hypothetical protein